MAPMGAWKVEEVHDRLELNAITDFLFDYADYSRNVFFPLLSGSGGDENDNDNDKNRETSLKAHRDRLWREHTADPSSHWVFVRDPSTSSPSSSSSSTTTAAATTTSSSPSPPVIIGTCQWRFYPENPFPDGMPDVMATWWPEGSGGRAFATKFTRQIIDPRSRWMNRPHVGMSWIAVHPSRRQQGIGTSLMGWGMRRTDELQLESYIEGTELGKLLYSSCGYRLVTRIDFDMTTTNNKGCDETWQRLERLTTPGWINVMWRPALGIWNEGEPARTWKNRLGTTMEVKVRNGH